VLVWSLEDTTGCNYVSLKLARVFSKLKGCADIVPEFFWELGMAGFLLTESSVLKLLYCKSIPLMNFNDIFCYQSKLVI